jgi:hypothetical protein
MDPILIHMNSVHTYTPQATIHDIKTAKIKMPIFWDVTRCHPDDVGSKHLWNLCKFLRDYTDRYEERRVARIYNSVNSCTTFAEKDQVSNPYN